MQRGVLASPVGPFDRDGYNRMLALPDLKLVVRLHHFHHVLRWAYRADARKAHKDMRKFLEDTAKADPSDSPTFLADVPQHFAVFYGDADDIIEPSMPAQVAQQLPQATATVWPGAGHYGFVDAPRWREFLTAARGGQVA